MRLTTYTAVKYQRKNGPRPKVYNIIKLALGLLDDMKCHMKCQCNIQLHS